jgi:DNA-binding transcriptional regulator YdaS (Cro superfamily)
MDLIEWQAENRWPSWILAERLGISANMLSQVRHRRKVPSMLLAKAIVAFTRGQVELSDLGVEEKC